MKAKPAALKKTSEPCTSTASDGALKCALAAIDALGRPHAVHTTLRRGAKAPTHTTWSNAPDGRVTVIEYKSGKRTSERFEGEVAVASQPTSATKKAPKPKKVYEPDGYPVREPQCGSKFYAARCLLLAGHVGAHFVADVPTAATPAGRAWSEDDEPNHWDLCGGRLALEHGDKGPKKTPAQEQTVCLRPAEHDGDHRGLNRIGNHMDEWAGEGPGRSSLPKTKIDFVAELLGETARERFDKEQTAPEATSDEATPDVYSADKCKKCGFELGEHDGKKCPKPVVAPKRLTLAQWIDSAATWGPKTRGDLVVADVDRIDGLSAATSDVWHVVVGRGADRQLGGNYHLMVCGLKTSVGDIAEAKHDQVLIDAKGDRFDFCPGCVPASEIVRLKALVASSETEADEPTAGLKTDAAPAESEPAARLICGYPRHPAAALFQLLEGEQLTALADSIEANGQRDRIVLVTVGGKTSILDGSNRGIACEMRKIKPQFVNYEGPKDMASLIAYSMDKNKHRRHQEPSVLAMVAVDAGQLLGRGNPGNRETGSSAGLMTQAEAGKKLGISERLVRKAKVVHDKGTSKLNDAVRKGKMAVDAAEQVSKLPAAKQDEIADEALSKSEGKSVRGGRVKALVRQEEKRAVVHKINTGRVLPMPDGPFGVIYGDYPWMFENSDQHEGSRGHMGYPPMSLDEIIAHAKDMRARAAEDCVLGLWAPNWHIVEQMKFVLEAYGALHRTVWTWPKPRFGVGTWGRGQTEHLVIASIGEPVHTLNEVSTLLPAYELREHSRKPDEVAELLVKHCSGPHIELFGREPRDGYVVWGAEPRKFASEAA